MSADPSSNESSRKSDPVSSGKKAEAARPRAQVGVVANIRDRSLGGGARPPVDGHTHFEAGAKVHVLPLEWAYKPGDELRVIGRQKDTGKLACMIVRRKFLTGWRVKNIHTPRVLTMVKDAVGERRWTEKSAASFVQAMEAENADFDV